MLQLFKKNFYIFIFREQAREEEIILLIGRAACNSFRGGGGVEWEVEEVERK